MDAELGAMIEQHDVHPSPSAVSTASIGVVTGRRGVLIESEGPRPNCRVVLQPADEDLRTAPTQVHVSSHSAETSHDRSAGKNKSGSLAYCDRISPHPPGQGLLGARLDQHVGPD